MLAGGVISAAWFAVQHPDSVLSRLLHGASYAAIIVNPVSGLAPIVEHTRVLDPVAAEAEDSPAAEPVPSDPVQVPEDPLPAEEELVSKPVAPGPIEAIEPASAPIVIPEDDQPMPQTLSPVQHTGPINPAAECPPGIAAGPTVMPYCEADEEPCEMLTTPTPEAEILPMPSLVEEETGCQDTHSETPPVSEPAPGTTECQEAPHHDYIITCPYTGKSYPSCPGSQPCQPKCKPAAPPSEEASETHSRALHRKSSLFRNTGSDEVSPCHPEVDTMEFRPSDRLLSDYGPGPL
jgi:hypothetical protein